MSNLASIHKIWIVDTFTPVAFRGNPAAVCVLEEFLDDESLQIIAMQSNLSETAFVVKRGTKQYDLRWFTPEVEVDLCGHATLASAHVLVQAGELKDRDTALFNTRSGELKARIMPHGIELDLPTLPGEPAKPDPALKALGVEFTNCQRNRDDFLVEVKDFNTLISVRPNMKKLANLKARGVIVTTAKDVTTFDFASRFFAPGVGVEEDPVTGSAHCFLAPYWAEKLGKKKFHAFQASRGRGVLDITLAGERTLIAGQCVTTLRGEFKFRKPAAKKSTKGQSA
jgi:PhzF family phenazine biosynthesis protein